MPDFTDNIFTYVLTNETLLIKSEYGVRSIAMKLVSGNASFYGTMKLGSLSSGSIPLVVNDSVTVSDDNNIDGLTIDATAGSVQIIARK